VALATSVAEYSGLSMMGQNARKRRTLPEERVKRFPDGRSWNYGGFTHNAAECVA